MSLSRPLAELIDDSLLLERAGDVVAALRKAQQALDRAHALGDAGAQAAALVAVARVRFQQGYYESASNLGEQALALASPSAPARADAWQLLANCAAEAGTLGEAETFYRRAAELSREIGHRRGLVDALHGLAAAVYIPRGQFDLALAADDEAYSIATSQDLQTWSRFPLITIAMAGQLSGQRARARAALDQLAAVTAPGSIVHGYYLCISAALALDDGDLDSARRLFRQARSVAEVGGEPWMNACVRLGLSRCHRLAGDWPQARAWAADALAYATHVGYHHEQGKALIERGRAAWLCGEPSAAEADLQAAIRLLADLGAAFDLARARLLLAALVHDGGQPEAAAAWGQAMQTIVSGGYAFLLEQEREVAFPLLAAGLSHPDPALANASRRLLRQLLRLPPQAVRFVTLGRFEVSLGCRSIDRHDLRRRRAGDLLALLLLSPGHRLPVVQAAEALWPDKGEKDASTALHHATSALRRILEPDLPDRFPSRYLETNEGWLYLALPPGSEVDFETFEVHCRGARWEAALALYGGDLLPECLYADWTSAPRRRLVLLFQRALLAAATDRLAAGCFQEALDACQQLIELEPWHEQAVSLAMRASLALNDLAGARRLYLALERALREDLGTMPQEELQALYRSLTPPLRQR